MAVPHDEEALLLSAAASWGGHGIRGLGAMLHTLLAASSRTARTVPAGQWQRIAAARGFYRRRALLSWQRPPRWTRARVRGAVPPRCGLWRPTDGC